MSYQNLEEGDALLESSEVTITTVTTPSTSKKIIALCATIVLALGSVALLYKPLDMTPVTSTALAYIPEESKAYYNGRRYAVLGGASASAMNYKCMSGWNEMPDGWEQADASQESQNAVRAYGWNTHVLYLANGCGYGTAQYTPGIWTCSPYVQRSGNSFLSLGCSINVLLVEKQTPPTQQPISSPTKQPTDRPISSPTDKPIAEPTQRPTDHPIAEPTHKPSKEPIAEPTHKPSKEPTESPTDKPSRKPTAEPTMEPTLYPTVAATDAPKDVDYCDYVFVKGISSESISPGCAVIAEKDLNFLEKGGFSPVIVACARENHGIEITLEMLEHAKITGVSYAKSGEDAEIDFFSKKDKSGYMGNVKHDDEDGGSMVHKMYPEKVSAHDNINSLYVKSSRSGKSKLPKDCSKIAI